MTEVRHTDPTTGAQKNRKPEMLSLLPYPALEAISRVYGRGAEKYSAHNWRGGYPWSWSYDALQRHAGQWWDGKGGRDIDPEWGFSHLAHAGFHIMTLLTYEAEGLGTDDRYQRPD